MPYTHIALLTALTVIPRPVAAAAQTAGEPPPGAAQSFTLDSRALGEPRVMEVSLPRGYAADTTGHYPVLVVLDGEFEGEAAMAVAHFYADMAQLPPLIVVAVRNTDRNRDMTPPPVAGFQAPPEAAGAGGAGRFLAFLSDELLPYLDRTYRTAPLRVLVGHSLGGLFALHALAEQPALFTGYVVMEPAAWWNNQREFEQARAVLQRPEARRARVMMVNAEGWGLDTTRWGGDAPMVRHLRVTGESHASMAMAGMMQGLREMFADFRVGEWQPGTRPIALLTHYDSLSERVGYPVPVPRQSYETVIRMSLDSRWFDDAAVALDRLERTMGPSALSREYRDRLERERSSPPPASFIPLEIPERRPTPEEARAFLGRWMTIGGGDPHEVEVRASGDTIVVHDRLRFPNGQWFEGDDPVVQLTPDGTLEWGLPFFRGIAALVVLRARIEEDGTMSVTREVRGWVPRGPGPELTMTERFRRVEP